jgi:hypothetical protein
LQRRPRAACICTFSNRHIEPALACANADAIYSSKNRCPAAWIRSICCWTRSQARLVTMVGCICGSIRLSSS